MLTCKPAKASEDLVPRIDVLSAVGAAVRMPGPRMVQVSELFDRFNTVCGRCHVAAGNGGKQTNAASFAKTFDATWLASVTTDDLTKVMPPENKPFSSRADGDPVRQLAALLDQWLAQGRPGDVFTVMDDGSTTPGAGIVGDYAYSAMTNLGECIPPVALYATSPLKEMESLDAKFAAATALPKTLAETDLTTFDAEALAANGVIAYVPTYPLWSDGSGKLRHIRVPKGTTVRFDKETQTFDIPPNTRFYKTFFRKVTDAAGNESNRKIETRLIVARPDTLEADGRTPKPTAIFGTYLWSEDELTATLHDLSYRDGTGFSDLTLPYTADELAYRDVLASLGNGSDTSLQARLNEALTKKPGVRMHYAVPGSIRCVQCHRGSPTHDFVLGFFPLQVAQRPMGSGGTYEPAGDDEMTQLQRLIDYGVISGMTSPADVTSLEMSEAPRKHRTEQELAAQGYMLGNCAHCHNPRGFPSLVKPELAGALNFMPSPGGAGGGIFEFPFERMSPVRARGASQDVPIPYITPSLRDYLVADTENVRLDNGAPVTGSGGGVDVTWSPKYSYEDEVTHSQCPNASPDFCRDRTSGHTFVPAPWRSLIYRNVDTPFPYFDDYVPFPHMPMNSAGFDCRAPRIMGDWMVSLPAVRKFPDLSEDLLPLSGAILFDPPFPAFDSSPQPYSEVLPTDPQYADAMQAAKNRLAEYHDGLRYKYCEDVLGSDILDPILPSSGILVPGAYHPDPSRYLAGGIAPKGPDGNAVQPPIGVPYHSHWFNYDPTDSSGEWQPRRGEKAWHDILVDKKPDESVPAGNPVKNGVIALTTSADSPILDDDVDNRRRVVEVLNSVELTDAIRAYATTELPFGLWQTRPECTEKLATMKKLSDYAGAPDRPIWMDAKVNPAPNADSPVYMMSPGGALYRHICFNCHGPKADGKGLQGDALAASSEGQARPANFMNGIFGPLETPKANLVRVFGGDDHDPRTADIWGSRYMAWMALGGTLQLIPKDVINQVQATRILGRVRPNVATSLPAGSGASANMLNLAKGLCSVVLPDQVASGLRVETAVSGLSRAYPPFKSDKAPFIQANGDWEMWMNICSRFSPNVVRVFDFAVSSDVDIELSAIYYGDPDPARGFPGYPANAPALDHNKVVQLGIKPGNYFPACIVDRGNSTSAARAPSLVNWKNTTNMPFCPAEFLDSARPLWRAADGIYADNINGPREWALRGAAVAGMMVFSYLEDRASFDPDHPKPYYNECQLLP